MNIELWEDNASLKLLEEVKRLTPPSKPIDTPTLKRWAKKAGFQVVTREGDPTKVLVVRWNGNLSISDLVFDATMMEVRWEVKLRESDLLLEAVPTLGTRRVHFSTEAEKEMINDLLCAGKVLPQVLRTEQRVEKQYLGDNRYKYWLAGEPRTALSADES